MHAQQLAYHVCAPCIRHVLRCDNERATPEVYRHYAYPHAACCTLTHPARTRPLHPRGSYRAARCPARGHLARARRQGVLTLGHLRYHLTDVPPQPNSPPDYVFCTGCPAACAASCPPASARGGGWRPPESISKRYDHITKLEYM